MSGNGIFFMVLILTVVFGGLGYFLYITSKASD